MSVWFIALILGFVEGLTEFIPVSSTGHLLIAEHFLGAAGRQSDLFNVVVQCGAVLAVLPLFTDRLKTLRSWREPVAQTFLAKIAVAFFITAVGGIILKKLHFKLPEKVGPVAWALIVGGVLFLVVEWLLRGRRLVEEIPWSVAVAVGFAQLAAAGFPGLSRSGATILIALALGTGRVAATEFSFLVGIPTLLAAGALMIATGLHDHAAENWSVLCVATAVAAVVSFVAVKWLLSFVRTHTFTGFGLYRIAAGAALLGLAWIGK